MRTIYVVLITAMALLALLLAAVKALHVNIAVYLRLRTVLSAGSDHKTCSEVLEISKLISRCLDPRYETASRLIFLEPS